MSLKFVDQSVAIQCQNEIYDISEELDEVKKLALENKAVLEDAIELYEMSTNPTQEQNKELNKLYDIYRDLQVKEEELQDEIEIRNEILEYLKSQGLNIEEFK